jgi:hypothetical protein
MLEIIEYYNKIIMIGALVEKTATVIEVVTEI